MAFKTITIDIEAYGLLSRQRRPGQSFSQVIKAHFAPTHTAGRLLETMRATRAHVDEDALDATERQIQTRSHSSARAFIV
jgi:predicted CopG family antitoxin